MVDKRIMTKQIYPAVEVDVRQYFAMTVGTKGRYLKITGTKLKDERRMQFTEIEVFGSK